MSEHLKYFETLNKANGYMINDIPFVGYIDEVDLVIYQTEEDKMIIVNNNLPGIANRVDIMFDTLDDADGYIILTAPWSCYIKENGQVCSTSDSCQKIIVENNLASFIDAFVLEYTASSKLTEADNLGAVKSHEYNTNTKEGKVAYNLKITYIQDRAFYNCNSLTSITIPDSVTNIGNETFRHCGYLASVTILGNVTRIGKDAFNYCSRLTSVTIPNRIANIEKFAFYYCQNLTSIPGNIVGIGLQAFEACTGLQSVIIPNSVRTIESWAFYNCSNITSVIIHNNVLSISNGVFGACIKLASIVIDNNNPRYDSRDNCNAIIETSSNTLIMGCKNTVIPNSITRIYTGAFYGCSSLASIDIPSSVTSIKTNAFKGCNGLGSITCRATNVPSLENTVFDGVNKSIPLYVPAASITAYRATDQWKDFTNIQAINE